MSDFAELVRKINAIDSGKPVSKKNIKAPTVSENPTTLHQIHNRGAKIPTVLNEKKSLVKTFKKIEEAKKVAEQEATETMQDRFAKFLKAEREAGSEVEEMKQGLEEASAEYEYADKAFSRMSETINTLEKMVREGGMLEKKIAQAGGDATALIDMREALSSAYEACEASHYHAMGSGDSQSGE